MDDRWTDRHDEVNRRFSQFCKRPKHSLRHTIVCLSLFIYSFACSANSVLSVFNGRPVKLLYIKISDLSAEVDRKVRFMYRITAS